MAAPLSAAEFDRLMARLGPFEARPMLAVGVSGGADSMALALLADEWARARGGEAAALTVDHRLRPGSGEEALRVAAWLAARGMNHRILAWQGDKPVAGLQAAAREARYRLLGEWCRAEGILHLLVAHNRDDQAETLLLRLGRGSGVDGLAAMAPVVESAHLRLLRPLLDIPRRRIADTLEARGQEWLEDPSNRNPAFARVRMRALMPALAAEGIETLRLAETARRLGRARAALETAEAEAAARFVFLHPGGFAVVDRAAFGSLPEEVGLRLLSRLLLGVGGGAHTPRLDRLEALHRGLAEGLEAARTLSGCRVVPERQGLLFCREAGRAGAAVPLCPGLEAVWDGRFRARLAADAPSGLSLGPLGPQGWRRVRALAAQARLPAVPAAARPSLPAIYDNADIFAVPHLGYNRDEGAARALATIVHAPPVPLTVAGHCLV